MHCFERTCWFILYIGVMGNVLSQGAPTEEQNIKSFNSSFRKTEQTSNDDGDLRSYPGITSQLETNLRLQEQPHPDIILHRPPVHSGPGNYLETRRRQTENRIQQLETQMNLLLEAQKQKTNQKPDPERELRIAVQHGLNCKRGDTVLVCLMKKVVILRREMSEIRRDVSELGKRVADTEANKKDTKDTDQEEAKGDKEKGRKPELHDGHEHDSQLPEGRNTTETTETPKETLPQYDPLCPPGYERVGNVCYFVITDRTGGVTSSREFCKSHGGYLARPRDSLTIHDLANHLSAMRDAVSELWVDGQYHTEQKAWRWNDGEKIDSSIWGISDTPSRTHRTGTCVLLKKELNYLAMPQDCGYHYFFVCQVETKDDTPSL